MNPNLREGRTVLHFPAGIPGLPPELKDFELLALAPDSPFFFLQSLQDEHTGFILVNPFFFFPTYEFELPDEEAAALGISSPEQVAVFCIVNARRGFKKATVNLLAPVVVNVAAGTARQVVLVDRRYGLRHPLPVAAAGKAAKPVPPEEPAAVQGGPPGEGK